MFLDLHVAFVVEKAVKYESRIAVGAFDGHAVEGSVIIREEGIEFESEVAEACTKGNSAGRRLAFFASLLLINAMRKTRKGRRHAQKGKARRVQQMAKLRQKPVRRAALSLFIQREKS
jgi:hypothetical protein